MAALAVLFFVRQVFDRVDNFANDKWFAFDFVQANGVNQILLP